jgi:cellulose synthase (UDP-forming)
LHPFDQWLLSSLGVLTALPYFVAISNDLHRAGYRRSDVVRLYRFDMMLLPIDVVGTLESIGQAIGGQKVAFARTPKVRSRTVTPLLFVVVPFLIIDWSGMTLLYDLLSHPYLHATFAGLNAVCTLYATLTLHGMRNSVLDVVFNLREWVYRPQKQPVSVEVVPDWVSVLYYGRVSCRLGRVRRWVAQSAGSVLG